MLCSQLGWRIALQHDVEFAAFKRLITASHQICETSQQDLLLHSGFLWINFDNSKLYVTSK